VSDDLASFGEMTNNGSMTVPGRVQNGVVILEGATALPEGAAVSVTYSGPNRSAPAPNKKRIEVPLVRTGRPGTLMLTGELIAQILDEEDASPRR
jgi:hypothetical protein